MLDETRKKKDKTEHTNEINELVLANGSSRDNENTRENDGEIGGHCCGDGDLVTAMMRIMCTIR